MKIAIRGGHSLDVRGASSKFLDEVNEDRRVKDSVISKLKQLGHDVLDVTPNYSKTSLNDLSYGVNKANNWGANYFASIHFNAGGGIGVECLYLSSSSKAKFYAERISSSIASLGFRNRGAKADIRGLYELRHTKMVANIIEVCFVDTQSDANLYRKLGVDAIANAIVKGITGQGVSSSSSTSQSQSSTRTYLQKGDRSGEVKQIQTMLIKLGYNCGGYGADGAYGQGCVDSVKSFQSKHGLSSDGLCGVATKTKIKEEYNKLINKSNQNASQNTNKKEEEYDMENIVVYGNEVDQRIAETLADFLQCPTIDGKRPFNYSKIKNVICVGGKPLMANGKIGWTGYMTKELSGGNRYETIKLVLDFIEKYNK